MVQITLSTPDDARAFIAQCIGTPYTQDATCEIWLRLSGRTANKLNNWSTRGLRFALKQDDGCVLLCITRQSIGHVVSKRQHKDNLDPSNVEDMLDACLLQRRASFAPNESTGTGSQRYLNQLLAFVPSIKSTAAQINGFSPVTVLEANKLPMPHLSLITGYWARQGKIKALNARAL